MEFVVYAMMMGALGGADLPFWATSGNWGLVPEDCVALARIGAHTEYDRSKTFQWRWGANMAVSAPGSTLILDEAYISGKWKVFSADLGWKHRELDYMAADPSLGSLSVTGGHVIESGNARTMPGIRLNLDPVAVPLTGGRLNIYGTFADFKTTDDRYVQGALLHRMLAGINYRITDRLDFDFQVDHYALWGGIHPVQGVENSKVSWSNYLRVIVGAHGGDDASLSDQINVIGDHGGAELLRLRYKGEGWTLSLQHDIPYSDGSGMQFQNFPDGVNTVHFGFTDKNRWISDVLLEQHYTMWQSGDAHDVPDTPENRKKYHYKSVRNGRLIIGGCDNYFNNSFYRSGWTSYGRMIGDPLMTVSRGSDGVAHISNNRIKAWHFGLSGKLFRYAPYKLMLTYSDNYGTYGRVWNPSRKQLSGAFTGGIPLWAARPERFMLTYGIYADKGELLEDRVAGMAGLKISF